MPTRQNANQRLAFCAEFFSVVDILSVTIFGLFFNKICNLLSHLVVTTVKELLTFSESFLQESQ